jgi:carboxylesterase type B
MWSNGPGLQPKSASNAQDQFDELLSALDIPLTLSSSEKLSRLRSLSAQALVEASTRIKHDQFRPWTDSAFISPNLFRDIDNGSFARRMAARNIRLMNGECRDEHFLYATWHPPMEDSVSALRERIEADYLSEACDALVELYYPSGRFPPDSKDWLDAFGRLYADIQVHMLERGFLNALGRGGAGHLVYRYRIEYRVKCVDNYLPPEWGVSHTSDKAMWLWGNGYVLEKAEKSIVKSALIDPLVRFVRGESDVGWKTKGVKQVRRLRPDGTVDIWDDTMWERGQKVWRTLQEIGSTRGPSAKL